MTANETETIAAIATPPGRGGIGVLRLSGPKARAIGESMLRLHRELVPRYTHVGALLDRATPNLSAQAVLDEVVVTFFAGPRSYTGEDVLEIAMHGAPVVLEAALRGALAGGARLAAPGEFTERAFRSGRLDLTQAEAVGDLIAATTLHQARVAAAQLGGTVSRTVAPLKEKLLQLIAPLEAGIDFAEDDLDVLPQEEIISCVEELLAVANTLLATYQRGRVLREGFSLAIVGQPNVGKSSLFNALLGRDRAIVTATPGTTRDLVTERYELRGIPVELMDTAGLREAQDEVEVLGIARSRSALAEANVILLVVDATRGLQPEELGLLVESEGRTLILAANKCDLLADDLPGRVSEMQQLVSMPIIVLPVSARTGMGLPGLQEALCALVGATPTGQDSVMLTSLRQQEALGRCVAAFVAAQDAARSGVPHEMLLLDLKSALEELDQLTGTTTAEDVLHRIFATFCIGK